MKNCNKFQKLLAGYIYGDLSEKDRDGLKRHLDICEACRRKLAGLRRTVSLVSEVPGPIFSAAETGMMRRRVKAHIGEEKRSDVPSIRRPVRPRFYRWAPVAAAAMVALLAVLIVGKIPSPDSPPAATPSDKLVEMSETVEEEFNSISELCREIDELQSLFPEKKNREEGAGVRKIQPQGVYS